MPKEKNKNEELVGCTVLFKNEANGLIQSATITSLSPSGDFLHAGDGNIWIDPEQIVETINDPNNPPEPEEVEEVEPVTFRSEGTEMKVEKGKSEAPKKEAPKKK
jgi:hypothetical protein